MVDAVLEAVGISKSFGALKANTDINIDLRPGEIHAVIGPNGAGKSTLIKQICGGLKPDSGDVFLLGKNVTKLDTPKRTQMGLGRTFQVSALAMQDTVLQNAMLGAIGQQQKMLRFFQDASRNSELLEPAFEALKRVGLEAKAQTTTSEISHGERRQLEVAVALTLNPKVFVMDEPMAGLGTEGSTRMTDFLGELRTDAPILLVEHDMDAVFALADRISVLVYGEIIASGTVDEIRSNALVRQAYLGEEA
ncbi:MAG: ABC transporter ATP-binding protein [Pseudomonadota bacterium]